MMRAYLKFLGILSILGFVSGAVFTACGSPEKPEELTVKIKARSSGDTCDGQREGSEDNSEKCEAGYLGSITRTCVKRDDFLTWEITASTCRQPPSQCENDAKSIPTFKKDILPIIEAKCIECHGTERYNEYGPVYSIAKTALKRFTYSDDDPKRMPPPPRKGLDFEEIVIWEKWIKEGRINENECQTEETRTDLNYNTNGKFIDASVDAAIPLDGRGRLNARFITADTKFNAGATTEEMEIYRTSINDAINAVSLEDNLQFCASIDLINGACKIDLESIGRTAADWDKIVGATTLLFIDDTDQGRLLRELTGTDYPSLTGAQFVEGAIDFANNYYEFLEIPYTLDEYWVSRGVDFDNDILDFRARAAGMTDSLVSARKNRLILFLDSTEGKCSITFDPIDASVPESNLAKFPLIGFGVKEFLFTASETICDMPNGGQEYALWDAAGNRLIEADPLIVSDFRGAAKHGEGIIETAKDCFSCHRGGWNLFQEQIKASALANRDLSAQEIRVVDAFYVNQTQLNGIFTAQNDQFTASRKTIGIDTQKADPITIWADEFIAPWSLDMICGHIRLRLNSGSARPQSSFGCADELKTTAVAGDLAPIFEGGTISKIILDRIFDVIVADLGIGENEINQ